MKSFTLHNHYVLAFWITLSVAIGLIVGGFFTPPMGEVSGTVLTAVGELFLWPALAFGAKALSEGNKTIIRHNNTEITVGKGDKEQQEEESI